MLTSTGHPRLRPAQSTMRICCDNRGQAVVEFTLCFILLVIIAWIPADFGLMFYTGHVGQNAAARARGSLPPIRHCHGGLPLFCNLPCSGADDLLQRIANRVAAGLMANAGTIYHAYVLPARVTTCDKQVEVRVTQTYYPFFYKILRIHALHRARLCVL